MHSPACVPYALVAGVASASSAGRSGHPRCPVVVTTPPSSECFYNLWLARVVGKRRVESPAGDSEFTAGGASDGKSGSVGRYENP